VAVLGLAAAVAAVMRLWVAVALSLAPALLALAGLAAKPWVEMALAIGVGTAIGTLTGFLVARVGMPSFVVTLALFLAWQGVLLQLIGDDGVLGISSSPVLFGVANGNLSVAASWALFVLAAGAYAGACAYRQWSCRRKGLVAQPTGLLAAKAGAVVVAGGVATYLLTVNRAPTSTHVITGVPYVVPIVLGLLVAGTYVLRRTRYGAHLYAVGGNREAARRAGIDVAKVRASAFVICSTLAAVGAIVYSSKVGSVDPQAGGVNTLLFAVGAAVIGGTSLFGGRGRMSDAVVGGLVIAVIQNGLGLTNQPAARVSIVTGLVLLLAAAVDCLSRRRVAVTR
jgi:D-xylose transport system permease protein